MKDICLRRIHCIEYIMRYTPKEKLCSLSRLEVEDLELYTPKTKKTVISLLAKSSFVKKTKGILKIGDIGISVRERQIWICREDSNFHVHESTVKSEFRYILFIALTFFSFLFLFIILFSLEKIDYIFNNSAFLSSLTPSLVCTMLITYTAYQIDSFFLKKAMLKEAKQLIIYGKYK